jgi:hypothetical protein
MLHHANRDNAIKGFLLPQQWRPIVSKDSSHGSIMRESLGIELLLGLLSLDACCQ